MVEDSDAGVASAQAAGFDVIKVPSHLEVAELTRLRISRMASACEELRSTSKAKKSIALEEVLLVH